MGNCIKEPELKDENEYKQTFSHDKQKPSQKPPMKLRGSNGYSFSASYEHFLIASGGSYFAWKTCNSDLWHNGAEIGTNEQDQSNSSELSPIELSIDGKDIVSVHSHLGKNSFFVTSDGLLYGCGENSDSQTLPNNDSELIRRPTKLPFANVKSVFCGECNTFVLARKGLFAFGSNRCGELGVGSETKVSIPQLLHTTDVNAKTISEISVGGGFTLFLLTDGRVFGAGRSSEGQLSAWLEGNELLMVPKQIAENLPLIRKIACGVNFSAFVDDEGRLWSCGENVSGATGHPIAGESEKIVSPARVVKALENEKIVAVSCGYLTAAVITMENDVFVWGSGFSDVPTKLSFDQLENVTPIDISLGSSYTMVLTSKGKFICYNQNSGEIEPKFNEVPGVDVNIFPLAAWKVDDVEEVLICSRFDETFRREVPEWSESDPALSCEVPLEQFSFACGGEHSLVACNGKCFGWSTESRAICGCFQLGVHSPGQKSSSLFPRQCRIENKRIARVHTHLGRYSMFETSDGQLYGAGENGHSQLGIDPRSNIAENNSCVPIPTRLEFFKISEVYCGTHHTFVRTHSKLYAIGMNHQGQLCLGRKCPCVSLPEKVEFKSSLFSVADVSMISCGRQFTLIVTKDGRVFGAGMNDHSQLTGEETKEVVKVTRIKGIPNVKQTAAGGGFSLFLTTQSAVLSCGFNKFGQCGLGTTTEAITSPQVVQTLNGKNVVKVVAGSEHSAALTAENKLYLWGRYKDNPSAVKTRYPYIEESLVTVPTLLEESFSVYDVSLGSKHTLLLTTDGVIFNCDVQSGFKFQKFPFVRVNMNKIDSSVKNESLITRSTLKYHSSIEGIREQINVNKQKVTDVVVDRLTEPTMTTQTTDTSCILMTSIRSLTRKKPATRERSSAKSTAFESVNKWNDMIACGLSHVLLADTNKLNPLVWGSNCYGQAGVVQIGSNTFDRPTILPFFGKQVCAVAACERHSMFKTTDGKLFACGRIQREKIGSYDYVARPRMMEFFKEFTIQRFCCGSFHSVVQTGDGAIYVFGCNKSGALGVGNNREMFFETPELMKFDFSGETVDKIACGSESTFFVTNVGRVYKTGVVVKSISKSTVPELISGIPKIQSVAAGKHHCLFLASDSTVYSMGSSKYGQLGVGDTKNRLKPMVIDSLKNKRVVKVKCSANESAFVVQTTASIEFYICGHFVYTNYGLGENRDTNGNVLIPVKIPNSSIPGACDIYLCQWCSFIVTEEGEIYSAGTSLPLGRKSEFGSCDYGKIDGVKLMVNQKNPKLLRTEQIAASSDSLDYMIYDDIPTLGKGTFGVVRRGALTRLNGKVHQVAVKTIDFKEIVRMLTGGRVDVEDEEVREKIWDMQSNVESEIRILKTLSHRNLLRYYGHHYKGDFIFIVTELCPLGTLLDVFSDLPGEQREKEIRPFFWQLVEGLFFLHSQHIVHRDIKPQNLFLAIEGEEDVVKIGDLGIAKTVNAGNVAAFGDCVRTISYSPPELEEFYKVVANKEEGTESKLAKEKWEKVIPSAIDIYALGVTMIQLVTGVYPQQKYNKENEPIVPKTIGDDQLRNAIERCMQFVPSERITARELLKHEYFQ